MILKEKIFQVSKDREELATNVDISKVWSLTSETCCFLYGWVQSEMEKLQETLKQNKKNLAKFENERQHLFKFLTGKSHLLENSNEKGSKSKKWVFFLF